jgi:hypothetical protein
MGRLADAIRANIMEKYLSSYMREKNVDALFVLRNENKWTLTGNCSVIFVFILMLIIRRRDFYGNFSFDLQWLTWR